MDGDTLVKVARRRIKAELTGDPMPSLPQQPGSCYGVFVTLRQPRDELRGCLGFVDDFSGDLARAVGDMAVQAAFYDQRFGPLQPGEFDDLTIEVSLLHTPESVTEPSQLNPKRYGVTVECGSKRGVLLPDIEGVDSVKDQLAIVKEKAGIQPMEPYQVRRFEVSKFCTN